MKRVIELDSLRGIAAILVLLSHYTWAYDYHFDSLDSHFFHFPYGDFGVQVFFIISGFVIFMSLNKINSIKDFVIARFSRLYPTYWLCMLITLVWISFFPVPTLGNYSVKEVLMNFTMIQGSLKYRHIDPVYWSLGIELFFYFIMGLLFYSKKIKKIDIYVSMWLVLCAVSIFLDYYIEKYINVLLILKHAPLFISGIMFYKIKHKKENYLTHIIIIASLFIYLISFNIELYKRNHYEVTFLPFLLVILAYFVFYYLAYYEIKLLRSKFFLFFGTISYPLYLLHNVVGYSIIYRVKMFYDNQLFYSLVASVVSVGLAYLVSNYFEIKSSKWVKKKLNLFFSKKYLKMKNHE